MDYHGVHLQQSPSPTALFYKPWMSLQSPNGYKYTSPKTTNGTATAGAAYAGGQTGYAVAPAATAATYGTQRAAAAGYDTAYQAAATQGTYAAAGAQAGTYQLAYGRTAAAAAQQSYDASKTAYYQQAAAAAAAYPQQQQPAYEAAAAPKPAYTTTPNYAQTGAARGAQPAKATQYGGSYGTGSTAVAAYPAAQTYATPPAPAQHATPPAKQAAAASSTTYSGYDAALYSAATMYVAQQNKGGGGSSGGTGWQGYKKGGAGGGARMRPKQSPKPQQLHYCDVCRISCAGPQTYREHLEGQKHKKKEASMKVSASTAAASTGGSGGSGSGGRGTGGSLRCELCDVTCTGGDAYAAHVRGIKHQKVVKLHTRLGKPIPSQEPKVVGGDKTSTVSGTPKIKFVSSGGLSTVSGTNTATVSSDANVSAEGESAAGDEMGDSEPEIQPVGQDYIEEIKGDDGKVLSFNCKLCDCRFNDPNAKEMHMKGRRHRLQYKKKVQPDLVVDVKPSLRQRKLPGQKMQRMLDELWARRRMHKCEMEEEERVYWEERRRFNEECDYLDWCRRSGPPIPPQGHGMQHRGHALSPPFMPPFANHLSHPSHPSHPPMPHFMPPPGRRPESADDRHVIASHAEIYPGEEELQSIQRVVSHTERALKSVSDTLTEQALKQQPKKVAAKPEKPADKTTPTNGDKKEEADKDVPKEDGRDNQLFSFLQEGEVSGNSGAVRLLKGVMRVGLLAKGLLLKGDRNVRLVVLCADKPTVSLLKRVAQELPIHLLKVTDEFKYKVELCPAEGAVSITDGNISVMISLTSPVMREPNDVGGSAEAPKRDEKDVLPKQKCLHALASLRHAKWFQARVSGLQSVVMVIRIMRDLCRRIPTWTPLNSWAMELMVEKVSSSAGVPLSPGECFRRVMEAVAGGLLLEYGPGLLDPCEKDHQDALGNLPPQKREDLTASAQQILRQIAFKQIHKVLDMEPLPPPWFSRKRRRSNTETEGDGKMVKTDGQEKMDTSDAGGD